MMLWKESDLSGEKAVPCGNIIPFCCLFYVDSVGILVFLFLRHSICLPDTDFTTSALLPLDHLYTACSNLFGHLFNGDVSYAITGQLVIRTHLHEHINT